jgi:hypothetical protein
MMGYGFAEIVNRIIKYLIEGLVIAAAAIFIPKKALPLDEVATLAVLAEAGAGPEHIVRMTWYVVDKREYLASLRDIGTLWRMLIGPHYPAMAVVEVKGLIEDVARIEIETTAVIPA